MPRRFLLAAALLLATASSAQDVVPAARGADWRRAATADDRGRLRHWRDAWTDALAKVRASADAGEIAPGGALFEPDTALPDVVPPPGDYDCRTVKLGAARRGLLDYVAYPAFPCRIAMQGGRLRFVRLGGSQRPAGIFFPDNSRRMIFLGTLLLGDEIRALHYGRDRERDLIGVLERVGERRWRIAFPYPHFESLLDVIELTPRQ